MTKRTLPLLALAALAGCQMAPGPGVPSGTPEAEQYQTQRTPSSGHLKQPLDRHKQKWYDKHGFVLVPDAEIARVQLVVKPDVSSEAWDALTLTIERMDPTVSPQVIPLFKGTDLVPEGDSFQATGSLLPELPPGDYAWTVSLWQGGPGGTLVGEERQELELVNGDNSVKLSPEAYPTLGLIGFEPIAAVPGATVSIIGQGFSVLPSQDLVTIGGLTAPVVAASSTRLTVVTPNLPPGSHVVWVQVGTGMVGKTGFVITAP